jgi:hypothetical protein
LSSCSGGDVTMKTSLGLLAAIAISSSVVATEPPPEKK